MYNNEDEYLHVHRGFLILMDSIPRLKIVNPRLKLIEPFALNMLNVHLNLQYLKG